ncbi:Maestro heat-like repeat-containing protein family member 2A [Plecturocebus cupreus]
MALGTPMKVKQYQKVLLEKCLVPLREPASASVTAEGMDALTKILAELREWDVGSSFDAISEQCRIFFDNESELLRLKAFVLFGKLARVVGMSKKHFFKGEVKKAWIPLMLHSQDPCSDSAQACMATMFQCVHFWGWKSLEHPSWPCDTTTDDKMTVFQTTMCSILSQKKPAVLHSFLLETMVYVKNKLVKDQNRCLQLGRDYYEDVYTLSEKAGHPSIAELNYSWTRILRSGRQPWRRSKSWIAVVSTGFWLHPKECPRWSTSKM